MSTAHAPFDVRIFHKEAKALSRAGFMVTIVVPHAGTTVVDGVCIDGLRPASGRRDRMLRLVWEAYRRARAHRADVYHFHDPELLPIGLLLKLGGSRVFYDVHEDLPRQIMHKDWIPPWARAVVARTMAVVEQAAARVLDGVVAATPAIAKRFPRSKTTVVQNFPILSELSAGESAKYLDRDPTVVYIGGIERVRGGREILDAMSGIADPDVKLEMAGPFYPSSFEHQLKAAPGWKRVDYRGVVSRKQLAEMLGRARVGLVLFHPLPNHVEAQPNKLFEYMSAGIPVVASDFPLWREIVLDVGAGLLVDPLDPMAIRAAVEWLLEHPEDAEQMGKAGQRAVQERFNWELESERLIDFYEQHWSVPDSVRGRQARHPQRGDVGHIE